MQMSHVRIFKMHDELLGIWLGCGNTQRIVACIQGLQSTISFQRSAAVSSSLALWSGYAKVQEHDVT